MNPIVMLDPKTHQHLKVDTQLVNAHAATQHLMPVVIEEFELIAANYPIVLTKHADTGAFSLVALLGFEKEENLFWIQSSWQASYVPLNVRRQPFFVAEDENLAKTVVCIDKTSQALNEQRGLAIFDEQGSPSDYFLGIQSMLRSLLDGQSQNERLIDTLKNLKLITPLTIDLEFDQDKGRKVQGLYCVDQQAFECLESHQIAELYRIGLLKPIYAMTFSLNQLASLIERKAQRMKSASAWFQ